jgi:hypothetical protein
LALRETFLKVLDSTGFENKKAPQAGLIAVGQENSSGKIG